LGWRRICDMAESERRRCSKAKTVDQFQDDAFFADVEEFIASGANSKRQGVETVADGTSENEIRSDTSTSQNYGFYDTDVVVIEAKKKKKCKIGSGVLLQDPKTWGKADDRPRRFVLTAAHCVGNYDGKFRMFHEIRIRVPNKPWINFPEDREMYPYVYSGREMRKFYKTIIINPEKQVFIHPRYAGGWWDGTDIALIAIQPIKPHPGCKFFDIWKSTSNSWRSNRKWDEIMSCAIVGFPFMKKHGQEYSHQPLVSLSKGSGIVEFGEEANTVRYHCQTHPGMSGGAVEFDNKIVGIHNAGDEEDEYCANGLIFDKSLKSWIEREFRYFYPSNYFTDSRFKEKSDSEENSKKPAETPEKTTKKKKLNTTMLEKKSEEAKSPVKSKKVTKDQLHTRDEYLRMMTDIYKRHNPRKAGDVHRLLDKYRGKEHRLYLKVCQKYGETPV